MGRIPSFRPLLERQLVAPITLEGRIELVTHSQRRFETVRRQLWGSPPAAPLILKGGQRAVSSCLPSARSAA